MAWYDHLPKMRRKKVCYLKNSSSEPILIKAWNSKIRVRRHAPFSLKIPAGTTKTLYIPRMNRKCLTQLRRKNKVQPKGNLFVKAAFAGDRMLALSNQMLKTNRLLILNIFEGEIVIQEARNHGLRAVN